MGVVRPSVGGGQWNPPVRTSTVASLPNVAGHATLLVDLTDPGPSGMDSTRNAASRPHTNQAYASASRPSPGEGANPSAASSIHALTRRFRHCARTPQRVSQAMTAMRAKPIPRGGQPPLTETKDNSPAVPGVIVPLDIGRQIKIGLLACGTGPRSTLPRFHGLVDLNGDGTLLDQLVARPHQSHEVVIRLSRCRLRGELF